MHSTVPQEQIDEVLIRHAELRRHLLEVLHRRRIKPNRHLTLQLLRVGVLSRTGKIIFRSHFNLQYIASSRLVALRAEISRIIAFDPR